MITFFDLFSGGGGAAQGAKQDGLTPVGGVELDPAIAKIYKTNHGDHRANAVEAGRVVALTIPALARLQSFPDDYQWSGRKATDGTVIGNSVCPLFFERIIRAVISA